jgi:hypothetical protein
MTGMTVIGPYRLLRTLGGCEAGQVWSAYAADGTSVTVAMIDPGRAADPRWLNGLMSGVDGLVRSGALSIVGADLSPPTPWVACAWDEGIGAGRLFTAGGLPYQSAAPGNPVYPPEPVPVAHLAAPTNGMSPVETVQALGRAAIPADAPTNELRPQATPPFTPPFHVPTAPPMSPPISPAPFSPPAGQPMPPARPASPAAPTRPPSAPPRRRRRGRGILVTLVILLLLAGAGTAAVWRFGLPAIPGLGAQSTPTVTTAAPVVAPKGPGVEPPAAGDLLPVAWATFGDREQTQPMSPGGVGFTFRAPQTWKCNQSQGGPTGVVFTCGSGTGASAIGGDLAVHPCLEGCDTAVREKMRKSEDAWALQWTSAGPYVTWAQTSALPAPAQYGLILIGYWRSDPNGPLNRQTVLRLTAPQANAAEIQKVANEIFAQIT